VAAFSAPSRCVNIIQLAAVFKVGVISACSVGSRPFQFTITGLSSSTPLVIFAPLRGLEKTSRRSCKSISEWKSDLNDSGLLKTFVRRCHRVLSSWYGPLEVMIEVLLWIDLNCFYYWKQ